MGRKDFFDFLTDAQKIDLRAELVTGPQPMVKMGSFWGDGLSVICAGDEAQMLKASAVRFRQKFHSGACRYGYYGAEYGGDKLPPLAARLSGEG